jgi:prepilin-type N-terminal cleavage/methylation domain-containing protein
MLSLNKQKVKSNKPRLAFKGFTLSELLVSLGVLGLIAGLTIPNVVASVEKSKNRSVLKEAYQLISSITNAGFLNGDFQNITSWDFVTDNGSGSIANYFTEKLNYSKQCLTADVASSGCTTGYPKSLDAPAASPTSSHNQHNARWILPNGAKVQFHRAGTDVINPNFMFWTVTAKGYSSEMNMSGTNPDTIMFECKLSADAALVPSYWGTVLKPGMCGASVFSDYATPFNIVLNS